jgi:hypothetical protein
MRNTLLQAAFVALAISSAAPTGAGTPAPAQPSLSIVRVPTPWYAPRFMVVRKMRDSIPDYERVPGLSRKIYTLTPDADRYGGIYHWSDRARAEAWFSPAWFTRVEKERGAPGEVRHFTVLRSVEHAPPPASDAVAVFATIDAGNDAAARVAALRATLVGTPAGLLREDEVSGGGSVGILLLWRDTAAASHWLGASWAARAAQALGTVPALEWYDAPIVLDSTLPANAPRAD